MVPHTRAVLASVRLSEKNRVLFQQTVDDTNNDEDAKDLSQHKQQQQRQPRIPLRDSSSLFPTNITSSAFTPTALVGAGTAVFCSSALKSATITPMAVVYMLLLALQYSIQPRISKKCLHPKINKSSVTLVEEVVKFTMASTMLKVQQQQHTKTTTAVNNVFKDWSFSSSLVVAGLPAVLYALQGILYLYSYQNLDAVTFNGISQTKMAWAALCCFLLLHQTQSPTQIVALILVGFSAMLFQGAFDQTAVAAWLDRKRRQRQDCKGDYDNDSSHKEDDDTTTTTTASTTTVTTTTNSDTNNYKKRQRLLYGFLPCLFASFLSGLAGALSQKGLQTVGGGGRNAYLYTMEVSGFSALVLILSNILRQTSKGTISTATTTTTFFSHWTWSTCWPILLKAIGGVLTALVHKHAGSVAKGFALICGLTLSGVIQTILDDKPLSIQQVIGMLLVNLSSWLHFTNPKIIRA